MLRLLADQSVSNFSLNCGKIYRKLFNILGKHLSKISLHTKILLSSEDFTKECNFYYKFLSNYEIGIIYFLRLKSLVWNSNLYAVYPFPRSLIEYVSCKWYRPMGIFCLRLSFPFQTTKKRLPNCKSKISNRKELLIRISEYL